MRFNEAVFIQPCSLGECSLGGTLNSLAEVEELGKQRAALKERRMECRTPTKSLHSITQNSHTFMRYVPKVSQKHGVEWLDWKGH